ncbi:MAG: hypothetical protein FWD57_03665 [Polyangiaceae bacterium]|nr:hypothetical protein [Polyangiaceae bacterium]
MIRKTVYASVKLAVLLCLLYVFFFVNLGRRTAFGHVYAIFSTPAAQEAVEDLETSYKELSNRLTDKAGAAHR